MRKIRDISVNFHGVCDYLIVLLLVTSPLYVPYPAKDGQIIA